jgi:hypothetical protein
VATLQAEESEMKLSLARAKERWEMLGEERDAKDLERLQSYEKVFFEDIGKVQSYNRHAGSLWACSGFRVHQKTKFGLDWALIQLLDRRTTSNLVSLFFSFFSRLRSSLLRPLLADNTDHELRHSLLK